jgi:hypothetical protein
MSGYATDREIKTLVEQLPAPSDIHTIDSVIVSAIMCIMFGQYRQHGCRHPALS